MESCVQKNSFIEDVTISVLDSCDFEGGSMCDWTNRPSNNYDWQLNKGATLSSNTGPANDHTSGQGKEEGTRF